MNMNGALIKQQSYMMCKWFLCDHKRKKKKNLNKFSIFVVLRAEKRVIRVSATYAASFQTRNMLALIFFTGGGAFSGLMCLLCTHTHTNCSSYCNNYLNCALAWFFRLAHLDVLLRRLLLFYSLSDYITVDGSYFVRLSHSFSRFLALSHHHQAKC